MAATSHETLVTMIQTIRDTARFVRIELQEGVELITPGSPLHEELKKLASDTNLKYLVRFNVALPF